MMEMEGIVNFENFELTDIIDETFGLIFPNAIADEVTQLITMLWDKTIETDRDLCIMQQEQTVVSNCSHECTRLSIQLQHLVTQLPNHQNICQEEKIRGQKEQQEQVLGQKGAGLEQLRLTLTDKLKVTVAQLTTLQSKILNDELIRWKQDQQSAGNGALCDKNLDSIEMWCQSLVNLVWRNREQIKKVECLTHQLAPDYPGVHDDLPALNSQITQLLISLITNTFVIVEQPPQVIKTNTRFTSTVRLLGGGELYAHSTPPQIKVSIISEAQANALLKCGKIESAGASAEIHNDTGTMEYQPEKRQLSVIFGNMQLKKIKRAERRGTESVTNEKFSLLFQAKFSVGHEELTFHVWTLSLPVVVIVHCTQESHAWATVTWDNICAEPGRVPFAVPDTVPWAQVAKALDIKFSSATGRSLTEDNLKFLAEKALRISDLGSQDYSGLLLSWAQFCKDPLPGRSFTFWEWFYAIMKLTAEYLRGPWTDGYILGFVQRRRAEEMLASCAPGTFLMRFSDSQLGAITIAAVGTRIGVFMLQPFNSKDLVKRSLANRIFDFEDLTYLYPEVSKENAFSQYCAPISGQENPGSGYVPVVTVTRPIFGEGGPGTAS